MWEAPPLSKLEEAIESASNPIGMRMRAAYFLRQAYETAMRNNTTTKTQEEEEVVVVVVEGGEGGEGGGTNNHKTTIISSFDEKEGEKCKNKKLKKTVEEIVIQTLEKGLLNEKHGSLLRHEFAYVMGQLRDERCCSSLEQVLLNTSDCIMVRHECGEALGAIGNQRSIPTLQKAIETSPNSPEIGQTCEISLAYMNWKISRNSKDEEETEKNDVDDEPPIMCACMGSPYSSIDPAPPHPKHKALSSHDIGAILKNESLPLFERYRAMFSLRNRGDRESVLQLGTTLVQDTSSVLLRHEIAYVLGQIQSIDSLDALSESLRRVKEHSMVRHESAEALGAIDAGERWKDVEIVLKQFLSDDDSVIRDSCIVALDAADYWGHNVVLDEDDNDSADDKTDGIDNVDDHQIKGGETILTGHLKDSLRTNKEYEELTASTVKKRESSSLSFVQQKAVTNGRKEKNILNPILNHHFNVAFQQPQTPAQQ